MMAVDWALAIMLLMAVCGVFVVRDSKDGIVLFLLAGTLLSLMWLRLEAIDVALVEAIVGTALLSCVMFTLFHTSTPAAPGGARWSLLLVATLLAGIGVAGGLLLFESLPMEGSPAGEMALARVDESGITSPVTAVLLNFRGYDTLLEIVVLYLAWLCLSALTAPQSPAPAHHHAHTPHIPFMRSQLVLVVFPITLFGFYVLSTGFTTHGGAFHAGASFAGSALILILSQRGFHASPKGALAHLLWIGFAGFISLGALGHLVEGEFLNYPKAIQSSLLFALESLLALSIGVLLYSTFLLYYHREPSQ